VNTPRIRVASPLTAVTHQLPEDSVSCTWTADAFVVSTMPVGQTGLGQSYFRQLPWRLAHAGCLRASANVRVHKALQCPFPHDFTPDGSALGRSRRCLPDPLGPVPMAENDASGNRFVRRPPLAFSCGTITDVERAMGLEPTTSSLRRRTKKQGLSEVRAKFPSEDAMLGPPAAKHFVQTSASNRSRNGSRDSMRIAPCWQPHRQRLPGA
jgi:hypothetical protein